MFKVLVLSMDHVAPGRETEYRNYQKTICSLGSLVLGPRTSHQEGAGIQGKVQVASRRIVGPDYERGEMSPSTMAESVCRNRPYR